MATTFIVPKLQEVARMQGVHMSESTTRDQEDEQPRLRLVGAGDQPDEAAGEEPLTVEMIESLIRLRRRLQEQLFAPGMSTRPKWSGISAGN